MGETLDDTDKTPDERDLEDLLIRRHDEYISSIFSNFASILDGSCMVKFT